MVYAFCFLGEFGYELFNWQGLIRKFSHTIKSEDKIVVCGRRGMDIWYEYADLFIDISDVPIFKNSISSMYTANDGSKFTLDFEDELKAALDDFITSSVKEKFNASEELRLVFSCDINTINGIIFGPASDCLDIYGGNLKERNEYRKLAPDLPRLASAIEGALGFSLREPYILVQKRTRDIVVRSSARIDEDALLGALRAVAPVVLLDFNTGRKHDSESLFASSAGAMRYGCESAHEQAVLIANAAACVFLTEGDFGSHIYVPPFMGKDVFAIAPADIYEIGTTPIDFWNADVFRFGGKIIPFKSEDLTDASSSLPAFSKFLAVSIAARQLFRQVEENAAKVNFSDAYLWPRTPRTPTHQHKILERVGATDYDVQNPLSRPHSIIKHLTGLIAKGKLPEQFVLADLCGGDALVGLAVKAAFPKSEIIVQDCLKDEFETHGPACEQGVKLYGGYLQDVIRQDFDQPIDVVMLLNTYRGWANADLHENEKDLPARVDEWLARNARFVIVTATVAQICALKERGCKLQIIGKGEDDSHMLCIDNRRMLA